MHVHLVLLLVLLSTTIDEVAAQANILLKNSIYVGNTNCTGTASLTAFVEVGKCLQHTNRILAQASSVRYSCNERTVFSTSNGCQGANIVEPFGCAIRADSASVLSQCKQEIPQKVFLINYFPSSSCSGVPVNYLPEDGYLVSGVLDTCVESRMGDLRFETMITSYNPSGYLTTKVYETVACNGSPLRTFNSQLSGTCNSASGRAANSSTPFYIARMVETPQTQFIGQVDLNQNATSLNAQIAGASIGVLCGFTTLLILISMTGVLG